MVPGGAIPSHDTKAAMEETAASNVRINVLSLCEKMRVIDRKKWPEWQLASSLSLWLLG